MKKKKIEARREPGQSKLFGKGALDSVAWYPRMGADRAGSYKITPADATGTFLVGILLQLTATAWQQPWGERPRYAMVKQGLRLDKPSFLEE